MVKETGSRSRGHNPSAEDLLTRYHALDALEVYNASLPPEIDTAALATLHERLTQWGKRYSGLYLKKQAFSEDESTDTVTTASVKWITKPEDPSMPILVFRALSANITDSAVNRVLHKATKLQNDNVLKALATSTTDAPAKPRPRAQIDFALVGQDKRDLARVRFSWRQGRELLVTGHVSRDYRPLKGIQTSIVDFAKMRRRIIELAR